MDKDIWTTIIASLPGLLLGAVSLWVTLKKNPSEIANTEADTKKKEAETNKLYTEIADRWAEHVEELLKTVEDYKKQVIDLHEAYQKQITELHEAYQKQVKNLQLDMNQVRRDNESYRIEMSERDAIIEALKDWADRLTKQVIKHAPHIIPEKYLRRREDAEQPSKD